MFHRFTKPDGWEIIVNARDVISVERIPPDPNDPETREAIMLTVTPDMCYEITDVSMEHIHELFGTTRKEGADAGIRYFRFVEYSSGRDCVVDAHSVVAVQDVSEDDKQLTMLHVNDDTFFVVCVSLEDVLTRVLGWEAERI